jgi:hypothetical protein
MTPASPQTKPPEQLADAPFDDAQADLILQSSDEVPMLFRVFKNVLSLASPIFADMFSIPSPPSEKPHEVQVVPLSERSIALDIALRHIYPMRRAQPPEADNLLYARILAEFAQKYQVEVLDQFIIGYLAGSLACDPVGVYAIAVTYGYNDMGGNAARSCLNLPFSDLRSPYLPCATLEHILELLRYHVACGEAASTLASSDRSWISSLVQAGELCPERGGMCARCSMADLISQVPRGVLTYLHRSALILAHYPTPEAVTAEAFVLKTNNCQECAPYLRPCMLELSVLFGRAIKTATEQVSL